MSQPDSDPPATQRQPFGEPSSPAISSASGASGPSSPPATPPRPSAPQGTIPHFGPPPAPFHPLAETVAMPGASPRSSLPGPTPSSSQGAAPASGPAGGVQMPSDPRASQPGPRSAPVGSSRVSGAVDHESSIEIAPPALVEAPSQRPEGAKDPYIGTTFDHRYKIEAVVGEGGMGVVYRARHKVIDKRVAVKVLRADMARDREILDRFVQEAKAASSIGNAHIVDISDFGDLPDGSTYFVMEFLEGKSLTHTMEAEKRLAVDRICNIAVQIADGLAAAHARRIVHRDLKPDNIFLVPRGGQDDFVKLLDFGIAKVANDSGTRLTRAGAVFGTPHYMSPEQAAGAPVDHRTDIYSLGVMLYELTSGQLPFNADNFMGILTQHMYKAPVPIRALVPAPDCPPGLEAIVLKCLSKRPEARYSSMDDLAADVGRFTRGEVPQAVNEMMARSGGFNVPHDFFKPATPKAIVPATPPPRERHWPRMVWVVGAIAAVGLVTLIVVKGSETGATPVSPEGAQAVEVPVRPTSTPSAAAPVKPKTVVALAALPEAAVAIRDGREIKLPASVEIEEGKSVSLEIRAEGYEPTRIELDGSQPARFVKLTAQRSAKTGGVTSRPIGTAVRQTTTSTGSGSTGSGKSSEIVDPWK
jgi:serine/threonine-protein kinase